MMTEFRQDKSSRKISHVYHSIVTAVGLRVAVYFARAVIHVSSYTCLHTRVSYIVLNHICGLKYFNTNRSTKQLIRLKIKILFDTRSVK